jgi:DNA-binding MarR family transcriptional regulator
MTPAEYRALAEFRFLIRRFLNNSEKAARSVGLEPQQYQGLLTLRGLPTGQEPTIRALATRLQIRHHSAVELVDRMEKRGLFRRERSRDDRRAVLLRVTPRGEKLLSRLVRHRIAEMAESGPALARALSAVIGASANGRAHGHPHARAGKRTPTNSVDKQRQQT